MIKRKYDEAFFGGVGVVAWKVCSDNFYIQNRHQKDIFKFSNIAVFSASVFALNTASINFNNDVNETYMTHGENLLNIQNWISGKIIIASYSLVKKYINLRMHLRLHTQFSQSNSNINEIHVNTVLIYINPISQLSIG